MNKFETGMVALLFVGLGFWWYVNRADFVPSHSSAVTDSSQVSSNLADAVNGDTNVVHAAAPAAVLVPAGDGAKNVSGSVSSKEQGEDNKEPEQIVILSNERAEVQLSSWGGGVVAVTLKEYRESLDKLSGPVKMNLAQCPALSYSGIPGMSLNCSFKVSTLDAGRKICFEKNLPSGLEFTRTVTLGDGYQLLVADTFRNKSKDAVKIPACELQAGSMRKIHTVSSSMGYEYLGIDSLPSGQGSKMIYWADSGPNGDSSSLRDRLQPVYRQGSGCSMFKPKLTEPLPVATNLVKMIRSEWVAVKNKFFVQVLAPKGGGEGIAMAIRREVPKTESPSVAQSWVKDAALDEVAAAMCFREREIPAGEAIFSEISYYAGPKAYTQLKLLGNRQDDVMEFGSWLYPISKLLLIILSFLYKLIPNYGVAVILLTLIVRVAFWPVTHKSTESMKEMQKIQPLINQVREKYKDKPQKMNQEVMAVYKEHKVNPMSGCLPILVQIPVFIALFTVLRSAVELRFAEFLWIKDLSEPENLLAGIVPFGLNILPILMAATMFWQQKLTPTVGDPQQQKMLLYMMPIMMLFMFYTMASALVLYWTVSQVISIYQLYRQKRKAAEEESAAHATA